MRRRLCRLGGGREREVWLLVLEEEDCPLWSVDDCSVVYITWRRVRVGAILR